ncbi:DUF5994 family protein [Nocardia sp. BMG51109]|uniref:DUF5994 family protein n=1 Tax=Nocardia sp. BMG51109 TaxID=1056816 RepID=UPI0012EB2BE8|nr:DUF5994 family protein [Nocardia sp. BMG51109]
MTLRPNATGADRQEPWTHRLRLELDAGGTGNTDGAWWPHSRDLAVELPDLFSALRPGFGPIRRVIYPIDEWSTAPKELDSGGCRVRLDGYRQIPARTLQVLGIGGDTLTLRIITPEADAGTGAAGWRWNSGGGAGFGADAWFRSRHRTSSRRGR